MIKNSLLLLALSIGSTPAFATSPEAYLVKSVICASGELDVTKAPAQVNSLTTIGYIGVVAAKTKSSLAENGRDAVLTMMVDGSENSACNNGNVGTLLTVIVGK